MFLITPLNTHRITRPHTSRRRNKITIKRHPRRAHPSTSLAIRPLSRIINTSTNPVLTKGVTMNRHLLSTILSLLNDLLRLRNTRLNGSDLHLLTKYFFTLLHISHLRRFYRGFSLEFERGERGITMRVRHTTLMFNIQRRLTRNLRRPRTLITSSRLRTIRTTSARPLRRASPTNLILLRTLNNSRGLAGAILVRNSHRRGEGVFVLSTPITTRMGTIRVSM